MLDDTSTFTAGDVIGGRYVLEDRLGTGGMGIVFTALQTAPERKVALKLLRPELRSNAVAVRRFRDEAIAASRLSHPNIVRFLDAGETARGLPFLAMQWLRGASLARLVGTRGAFPASRAARVGSQVLSALVEIHRLGMVHADVKCDNILVEPDGKDHATLIDFGLVRLADRPLVHDGEVSGTPDYIAPEIVLGKVPTPASDIYAVGCILYELVTGTTPFAGGPPSAIMARHVDDAVVLPSERAPDIVITPDYEAVILRALAKRPEARYPSAREFAAALAAVAPPHDATHDGRAESYVPFSPAAITLDWHQAS